MVASAGSSGTRVLQVTNIAPQATKDQMQTLFGFLGKVDDIRLYPTLRDVSCPVASRICYVRYYDPSTVLVAQHLTNTVFIDRALIVIPVANGEIPDEHKALEMSNNGTLVPGLNAPEPRLPAHIINTLDGVPPNQVIQTHDPKLVSMGLPPYPPLPAAYDSRKIEEIRRTVLLIDVPQDITTDRLIEHMNTAGEVKYTRFCNRDADRLRYVLVEFTEQESVLRALRLHGSTLDGHVVKVHHATQAITKPQTKSNEAAQREIEEAMCRVKEAQNLISAAIDPVIGLLSKDKRRTRSRSRSRRRSRSKSRSRHRSRRSRSRHRSRRSRSRHRHRSRSRSGHRSSKSKRSRSRSRHRSSRSKRESSRDRDKDKKDSRSKEKSKTPAIDSAKEKSPPAKTTETVATEVVKRTPSKERKRSPSKERKRSLSKERKRSPSKERKRSHSREKKSRDRRRSRSRSRRSVRRSRSRERVKRTRSRDRKRSRSRDRKRTRSRERKSTRSRERKRTRSRDRKRSRSRDRKRSRSKERKRTGSSDRKRTGSSDRKRSVSRERSRKRESKTPLAQDRREKTPKLSVVEEKDERLSPPPLPRSDSNDDKNSPDNMDISNSP